MRESAKNAMRSGLVVIGALAFGYLTLQIGFKPYLEKTQEQLQTLQNQQPSSSLNRQFDDANILISDEGFTNPDDS